MESKFSTIEAKMEEEYNLTPHKEADDRSLAIHEAFERGIKGIPTVLLMVIYLNSIHWKINKKR